MSTPLSIYMPIQFLDHYGKAKHNGRIYNFRTAEAAAEFLARVSKRTAPHARDLHKAAQRTGERPECIRRLTVKAQLGVIVEPPPDGTRPSPALRIIRPVDKAAEVEQAA